MDATAGRRYHTSDLHTPEGATIPCGDPRDVFINVPFDRRGEPIFVGLISSLVGIGLNPRSVLEIPTQQSRLERIFGLIAASAFSIHDLSRLGLSRGGGFCVPRFNMPFELGLAVAVSLSQHKGRTPPHQWWVLETARNRLPVSLSDLGGYDATVYGGTLLGLFRAVSDTFVVDEPPVQSERDMMRVYRRVSAVRRSIGGEVFRRAAFRQLVMAARLAVSEIAGIRAVYQ